MHWPFAHRWNLALLSVISIVLFRQVFLHADQMLASSDLVRLHAGFKWTQHSSLWEQGRFPLWDPTILCGRSIVGDPLTAVLNPVAWMFWASSAPVLFGIYFWLFAMLGAWGLFLWLRLKAVHPAGAVLAAVAFAFSGKSAASVFAGHMDSLPTMLCAPWIFWAAERILLRRSLGSAVVLGGVVGFTATLGHIPSLYCHILAVTAYVLLQCLAVWRRESLTAVRRVAGLFAVAGVVFALGAMVWWLPVVRQTLMLSARAGGAGGGYAFATMLSASPADLLRLLWPFHGLALPRPLASDAQNGFFWETASYPGLTALALACFAVVAAPRRREAWIFGALCLIALLLALGGNTPLYRLFYDVVPGVSLFRVPGRLLLYVNLFIAAMAGLGMDVLLRTETGRRWSFVAVAGMLLLVALGGRPPSGIAFGNPAGSMALSLLVLVWVALLAILFASRRIGPAAFAVLMLGTSVADLGTVWATQVFTVPPDVLLPSNSVVHFLESHRSDGPCRYFDPTGAVPQEVAARHGLQSIAGYHPGIDQYQLELYQALWPAGEGSSLVELLMHSPRDITCTNALDLMNVRFVVVYETELDDRFVRVFSSPPGELRPPRHVLERKDPLPRAFVVPRSLPLPAGVESAREICGINPREECLMANGPLTGGATYQPLVPGRQRPGDLELTFNTDAAGVLVVSESWHPDWVATDNGDSVAVHRANHGFVGIPLGAGAHAVHLWYRPWDFYLGLAVSGLFWLGVGLALAAARLRTRGTAIALPPRVVHAT